MERFGYLIGAGHGTQDAHRALAPLANRDVDGHPSTDGVDAGDGPASGANVHGVLALCVVTTAAHPRAAPGPSAGHPRGKLRRQRNSVPGPVLRRSRPALEADLRSPAPSHAASHHTTRSARAHAEPVAQRAARKLECRSRLALAALTANDGFEQGAAHAGVVAAGNGDRGPVDARLARNKSSAVIGAPRATNAARCTAFRSSRTLPVHAAPRPATRASCAKEIGWPTSEAWVWAK